MKQKYNIEEFLIEEENSNFHNMYMAWLEFAPSFGFELTKEDWEEVFSAMIEGLYEMYRVQDEDTKGEFIVAIDKDFFYGTYLVYTYTVPSINEILTDNNINIQYEWDNQLKLVLTQ